MNIQLQALPMNGRLVLFEYDDDDAKEDEDKKAKYRRSDARNLKPRAAMCGAISFPSVSRRLIDGRRECKQE